MIFTDTHTHLYSKDFAGQLDAVMQRAFDAGVQRFFLPNIDVASVGPMLDVVAKYPAQCFPMMGLHPCDVTDDYEQQLDELLGWFDKGTFYAVGEIGIDLYWDKTTLPQQTAAFKRQVEFAIARNLPICIHSRESFDVIADILEDYKGRVRGVFHCFTGTLEQANRAIGFGFMLGIGGVVTFKNGGIDKVLPDVDIQHLVLETDAPYLAPVPHRGKRNECSYIPIIAQKLADVKQMPLAELARITTENSERLFGI